MGRAAEHEPGGDRPLQRPREAAMKAIAAQLGEIIAQRQAMRLQRRKAAAAAKAQGYDLHKYDGSDPDASEES
jgi:hypothetical protein